MVELEQEFEFSNDELKKINELCEALAPMEMAVEYLCKDKANLLLAENVVMFTLKKLRDLDTKINTTGKVSDMGAKKAKHETDPLT